GRPSDRRGRRFIGRCEDRDRDRWRIGADPLDVRRQQDRRSSLVG
ncbi:MAG: hypothetical protein AVDCRST_MAG70-1604, partial [uncultured Thermomicrobiales bacterium]